jgi:hypothetical protein
MTDTAGVATERMWKRLGGSMYDLGSVTWLHLIHPVRAAVGLKLWRSGTYRWLRLARPLCRPLDAAYSRFSSTDETETPSRSASVSTRSADLGLTASWSRGLSEMSADAHWAGTLPRCCRATSIAF